MAKKYTSVVATYDRYADLPGISRDTNIGEGSPTFNYGGSTIMNGGMSAGGNIINIIVEVQMPEEDDIEGFDLLEKVELCLRTSAAPAGVVVLGIVEITDIWDEGVLNGAAGWCNWTEAQELIAWKQGDGAIKSRYGNPPTIDGSDGIIIDSQRVTSQYETITFDITPAIKMGETKTFVVFGLSSVPYNATDRYATFATRHSTSYYPQLEVTYRDYQPEGFVGEENLTIEPNPDNPEQPILKWGAVKDTDFVQYKLYREVVPITAVGALTPIATITDTAIVEYIDTDALVDGTAYYYKLIAEDNENLDDDALPSACVSFTKPDISGTSFTPSGDKIVGTQITITVDSPQNIKKIWVDWKDGCTSWYEFETVATSQDVSHIYSAHSAGVALEQDVRIEDENGFWSSLGVALGYKILDTDAVAKLLVNVKKTIVGDNVTLNATLSQPAASNATITSYKFWRYAGDPAPATQSSPIFTFSTVGYTVGTKTATVEITTSTSKTDTDTVTYELESGTPIEITPGYPSTGLSIHTKIHELPHKLGQSKATEMPVGSAGTEYEFPLGRHAERLTIHATTEYPAMESDITIIRNAWINNSYLRLTVESEMETKKVQYDFLLDGDVSLGHTMDNKITWSFPIRVVARTEVAKPKAYGAITVFANAGGGKVTATSTLHGLSVGMYVLITGTINYNGTYQITAVGANTITFVAAWVSNDAMGTWRKVGV